MKRGDRSLAAMVIALIAVAALLSAGRAAAAVGASISVQPAAAQVASGQTFEVQLVQDAPVPISGAQASVDFDPAILHVVSVAPGSAYADAPIFVPSGPKLDADIQLANSTGHLSQIAAALTPPSAVAPGPAQFLVVRFLVVGCGATDLSLKIGARNAQMISGQRDLYGADVPVVSTTPARVTTCAGQAPVNGTANAGVGGTSVDASPGGLPIGLIGGGAAALMAGAFLLMALSQRTRRSPDELPEGETTRRGPDPA